MELWLYNNQSDSRYINKKITQVGQAMTRFYLKDRTEVVNPIITTDDFPEGVNYCWLSEFNRYYYLKHLTHNEGQIITEWHVDVLMSFKTDLLKQKVNIKRSSMNEKIDNYLNDDELKIEQYTHDVYLGFNGGSAFSPSTNTFVLSILGSGSTENNENNENNQNNENNS